MSATMRDVARLAGVSVKTVSNVVNDNYPYIRPETRAAVESAMRTLGYRLNVTARKLRTNRTGIIGLALPELRLPYFAELADEVIRCAGEKGLKVLVEQIESSGRPAAGSLMGADSHLLDAAIIAPAERGAVLGGEPPQIPIVVLGDGSLQATVDQVYLPNARGAELAVAHLLAGGARRVAAVGADPHTGSVNIRERMKGYLRAHERHGLSAHEELLRPTEGWTMGDGARAVRGLLAAGVGFDAVFAFNDTLALGVLAEVSRQGRAVPDQVQIIGFDDIDDAQFANPPLSTVRVDRRDLARMAIDMVSDRLTVPRAGESGSLARLEPPYQSVEAPVLLVERGTTLPRSSA